MILLGKSICLLWLVWNDALAITSPYGWELRRSLNGLWNFKLSPHNDQDVGFREKWWMSNFVGNVSEIPVPSSFNDIWTERYLRDHLGWVWYQTAEPVDLVTWTEYRKVISFGGVHYYCKIWFGEYLVGEHEGGHVPFEFELPEVDRGYITVAVNSTLSNHTIPQGFLVTHHPNGSAPYQTYSHDFDYFDYAGINRNVFIYATSKDIFLQDVSVQTSTNLVKNVGIVDFKVTPGFSANQVNREASCTLHLVGEGSTLSASVCEGRFLVENPLLWWNAFSKHGSPGQLYSLTVEISKGVPAKTGDVYRTDIGIRSIAWNNSVLFLNEKPIYVRGFGKHEDSEIRGRGFDWAVTLRDFELLKWSHANAIRTTHYPPSLELVEMANRRGILLILESPACSLSHFDSRMLKRHKRVMKEIFSVFGNNPSVIMWSLANEPQSSRPEADVYFQELVSLMKSLDARPVTFVTSQQPKNDKAVKHVDVICVNRYNGWYSFPGDLSLIDTALSSEVLEWKNLYNVPFILTEYGAGSLSGLHDLPSSMWSEDYQTDLLKVHFKTFDKLKAEGRLAGEMMWVFADFATPQEYIRPGACVKGAFTRARQPKKAAFTIRERYENLNDDNLSPLSHSTTLDFYR